MERCGVGCERRLARFRRQTLAQCVGETVVRTEFWNRVVAPIVGADCFVVGWVEGIPELVLHARSFAADQEDRVVSAVVEDHMRDACAPFPTDEIALGHRVDVAIEPAIDRTGDHIDELFLDGHIHPMTEGDFVGWEGGTGITHVVLNNSGNDAILLVGGEAARMKNQFWYPFHPSNNKAVGANYWSDHPVPKLGPHDGLPDALRQRLPAKSRKSALAANTAALHLKPTSKKPRR